MRLSLIEFMALLFTGVAGMASAVQAYVSWETRGEVSRAIVFSERIDACAQLLVALQPVAEKTAPELRQKIAAGDGDGRYSLPGLYYQQSSGNAGFRAKHDPIVDGWRAAAATYAIVMPEGFETRLAFFDQVIREEIPAGEYMSRDELLAWLEEVATQVDGVKNDCRGMLQAPSGLL